MSSREFGRLAGLALVVGGVLSAIGFVVQSFAGPTSSLWVPTTVLALSGLVLILLAIPVVYAVLASAIGGLGLVGYVLLFVSGLLAGIGATVLSLIMPYLARTIPQLTATTAPPQVIGTYLLVAGIIRLIAGLVFGAAILGARTPERMAGLLLILGAIISFGGGIFNSVPHLGDLGRVLFVLALAWMGWTLMTHHAAEMGPSRAPVEGSPRAHARA